MRVTISSNKTKDRTTQKARIPSTADRVENTFHSNFPKEVVYSNFRKETSQLIKKLIENTNLPINFLAEYIFEITPKTFTRYRRENSKLPSLFTELAIKILHLYNEGIEIFGTKEIFNHWISKENIGLSNKRPLDLLNTSTGVDMIYEELKRIEFGATA